MATRTESFDLTKFASDNDDDDMSNYDSLSDEDDQDKQPSPVKVQTFIQPKVLPISVAPLQHVSKGGHPENDNSSNDSDSEGDTTKRKKKKTSANATASATAYAAVSLEPSSRASTASNNGASSVVMNTANKSDSTSSQSSHMSLKLSPNPKNTAKVNDSNRLGVSSVMDISTLNTGMEYCRMIKTSSYLNAVKIASGNELKVLCASADSTIHIHNVSNGRPFAPLEGHTDRVISLAVSSPIMMDDVDAAGNRVSVRKTLVASGARDETLRIWDLDSGICIHSIHAHKSPIWAVAIAVRDDGSVIIISTSGDGSMRSWNGKNGKKLINFKGHTDKVLSVYILNEQSDQPLLFSAGTDKTIRVWELLTGVHVKTFEGHEDEINSVVAQSYASMSSLVPISMEDEADRVDKRQELRPRGGIDKGNRNESVIVVSACRDLTIRVWDYKSGYLLFELLGHTACVFQVALCRTLRGVRVEDGVAAKNAVAPGAPIIVSCSDDATIKFWNLENGKLIKSMKWHSVSVRGIEVLTLRSVGSGSSQQTKELTVVASCGWDKTIQFHPIDDALISKDKATCSIS